MRITNTFDSLVAPTALFFGIPCPTPNEDGFHEKQKEYDAQMESFLKICGVESFNDNTTLNFSLGSILLDIMHSAVQMKIFSVPESPKLLRRMEKVWNDFALQADFDEIDVPDEWISTIDAIFSDDERFAKIIIHGEVENKDEPAKNTLALIGKVLNSLPKLRDAILAILPE